MTLRDSILQEIHAEAERYYERAGWEDEQHGVIIHSYTAEVLVGKLIDERRHVARLEDRLVRAERTISRLEARS